MKTAQIIHNPTSGDSQHSKEDIVKYVQKAGYDIKYISTDDPTWERFLKNNPDIIFLAGGDGTVHKLAAVLLKSRNLQENPPVYLLPMGTANNISRTLQLDDRTLDRDLKIPEKIVDFSHGVIGGVNGSKFFLESVGMGIFPKLITEMKNKEEIEDPEEKLKLTLQVLQNIVGDFEAEEAEITIDNEKLRGTYLMVEVMNTNYIGPNLKVAPNARPEDELLDLVLVPMANRTKLLHYLEELTKGKVEDFNVNNFAQTYRAKEVTITYQGTNFHVDDDPIEGQSGKKVHLKAASGGLKFFSDK